MELTALLTMTLPAVSLTIVRAWRIGTPLLTRVPRVRVKREIATLLTTGPRTGILSLNLSQTRRPNLVRTNRLKRMSTTTMMMAVQTIWSLIISLIPRTRRVNAGNCEPSNMPSKTDLKEGTTFTIRIIKIAVATTSTATG